MEFQFTHPGRGATESNGLSPHDVRVSIHAPREGCDIVFILGPSVGSEFQFTHPGRGATCASFFILRIASVFQFTHPGRGATAIQRIVEYAQYSFNSRTPGGVRPCWRV